MQTSKENYSLKQYYMYRKEEINSNYAIGGMGIYAVQDFYDQDIIGVDVSLILASQHKWYYGKNSLDCHIDLYGPKFGVSFGFFPTIKSEATSVCGILCGQQYFGSGVRGAIDSSIQSNMIGVNYSRLGYVKFVIDKIADIEKIPEVGDVLLISHTTPQNIEKPELSYLPIEYYQQVRQAIKRLTDKGVHVIIPAGDGKHNLDDPIYNGVFSDSDPYATDAIYVGAFNPITAITNDMSNYGSRVTACAWGSDVVTTDYNADGSNYMEKSAYTENFGGTIAATAQVASAVITIQSVLKRTLDLLLTPSEMKDILRSQGQSIYTHNIGTFPDVIAVLNHYGIIIPNQ